MGEFGARIGITADEVDGRLPLVTGKDMVTLNVASLASDLSCPICLEIMKNVVATECLHRFCGDCMEKCLRQNKKECPSCRRHVATRRSLRHDHNMDRLISTIFPDLPAYEADEEKRLDGLQYQLVQQKQQQLLMQQALVARSKQIEDEELEQLHQRKEENLAASGEEQVETDAARASYEEPLSHEERMARARVRARQAVQDDVARATAGGKSHHRTHKLGRKHGAGSGSGGGGHGGSPSLASGKRSLAPGKSMRHGGGAHKKHRGSSAHARAVAEGEDSIVFALLRHPEERQVEALEKEVLQTSRQIQIVHLAKFLVHKLKLSDSAWSYFRISLSPTPGTAGMASPPPALIIDSTLDQILRDHVADPTQLVLEYRLAKGFSYADVKRNTQSLEQQADVQPPSGAVDWDANGGDYAE